MQLLQLFRQYPAFEAPFDDVYPVCWLILVWQHTRFFRRMRAEGIPEGYYSLNRWGFLTFHLLGDRKDLSAYKPITHLLPPDG